MILPAALCGFLMLQSSGRPEEAPATLPAWNLQPSLDFLCSSQEKDGSWIADPTYRDPIPSRAFLALAPRENYFTDDSMAVTSLCARALLCWPGKRPEKNREAIARSLRYLERTMRAQDERFRSPRCSPIWQAYALDLYLDLQDREASEERQKEIRATIERILGYLAAGACKGGGWTYAYYDSSKGTPRSFTTALVLRSLLSAGEKGFELPRGLVPGARKRLLVSRLAGGGYRYVYHHPDWPPRATPMGSIGRMALIEGTLARMDRKEAGGRLQKAVDTCFAHWHLLAQAIQAQTRFGNEGCHHFFACFHLAEALKWLPRKAREEPAGRLRKHLQKSRREDGSWWDSKRAGARAATALALLALWNLG